MAHTELSCIGFKWGLVLERALMYSARLRSLASCSLSAQSAAK